MAIVALAGNKGGVGKTTLCVNLAAGLAARAGKTQRSIVLIDADPQQSSRQWLSIAAHSGAEAGFSVVDGSEDLAEAIAAHSGGAEHVLIDCPPSARSDQTAVALSMADVALIPVQPSPLDLWATVAVEEQIEAARAGNPELRAWLVINQLEPRTKLSQLMRKALEELSLPTARTPIHRRMAFRTSILQGKSVVVGKRKRDPAREEIQNLIAEVIPQ